MSLSAVNPSIFGHINKSDNKQIAKLLLKYMENQTMSWAAFKVSKIFANLYGERLSWNVDDGTAGEVCGEFLCIERGTHQDNSKVCS